MIHSYTGKPYRFKGYNCWDHVTAVRKDAGLKTKYFTCSCVAQGYRLINDIMETNNHGLTSVNLKDDSLKDFDIVLLSRKSRGRVEYHCGVYYNGFVSHAHIGARQVMCARLEDLTKQYESVTFWR